MHPSFTINGEWNKTKKKRAQGKQKKKTIQKSRLQKFKQDLLMELSNLQDT